MGLLRLAFLGTPQVDHAGRAVTFPTRKALALLAYLAVEGGRHTREAVAALFWPDSEAEQARGSLRYTLTALRGALDEADGVAHCLAERGVLAFNVGATFELDTQVVQAAYAMSAREPRAAMAALARAAAVCRGSSWRVSRCATRRVSTSGSACSARCGSAA